MAKKLSKALGASKNATTLLILFIPSVDRFEEPIADQDEWVTRALKFLGDAFGGATAFPKARGVCRDDARDGLLVFDEPVIINCYTSSKLIEKKADQLKNFLIDLGQQANQGAVGLVNDLDYLEIAFPMENSNGEKRK